MSEGNKPAVIRPPDPRTYPCLCLTIRDACPESIGIRSGEQALRVTHPNEASSGPILRRRDASGGGGRPVWGAMDRCGGLQLASCLCRHYTLHLGRDKPGMAPVGIVPGLTWPGPVGTMPCLAESWQQFLALFLFQFLARLLV